ncbi:MAG: GGDEF domain-containing protein [Actinobacteria bacterium]|nr:GGDEF domain-containing protein [Actinomycetota bacterium]
MRGQQAAANTFSRFLATRDDERTDSVGVPNRVHYWLLALFAITVASGPIIFAFMPGGEELRNWVTLSLCIGGLALAPLIVVVGRRTGFRSDDWIYQLALTFVLCGTFVSNLMTPGMIAPFLTLYLLAPVGAAFYLPTRKVLPLAIAGVAAILYMSSRVEADNAMLRGAILAFIAAASAVAASQLRSALADTVRWNHEISERDPLTGAYNMRKFDERLADEIARAERGGPGFALAMFDLDNFKQVNDSHNHSTGDEVLIVSAEAIASQLAPSDLLVRRGGDEFAVILPASPHRDPETMIEMARKRIERARREVCPSLTPFASAGFVNHEPGETRDELVARADAALHDAKTLAPERRGHAPQSPTPLISRAERDTGSTLVETGILTDDPMRDVVRIIVRVTIWLVGASFLLAGTAIALGEFEIERPLLGASVVAAWLGLFVPFVLWVRSLPRRPRWVKHAVGTSALALISAACLAVGDGSPTLADLFLYSVIGLTALLPFSRAVWYVFGSGVLYAVFLFDAGFPYAEVRVTVAGSTVALTVLVLSIVRHRTVEAAEEKAQLARTDALTGLPNMRRLRDRLDFEVARCERTGEDLALLMLDLDDFKSVNDQHSHWVGDKTLVAVADAIESVCRHADMPARRGGDEFAIVMTGANADQAEIAAERIALAIRMARFAVVADVNPDASVGWTVWQPGDDVDELIAAADDRLHEVKTHSRETRELRHA